MINNSSWPNNALKLTCPSAECLRWYALRWRSQYNEANRAQSAKQLSAVRWAFVLKRLQLMENSTPAFLRWIGGKAKIIALLNDFLPTKINRYWEPFLGAGSLFFYLQPPKAYLSDINLELINCFQIVRDQPDRLSKELNKYRKYVSEKYYYQIRTEYNSGGSSLIQAGRFIMLNRTCFNGIYRVNRNGQFNVPFGRKYKPTIPDINTLQIASKSLRHAVIKCQSFEKVLQREFEEGDFIYLDPPYPPLNETAHFTHYSEGRFLSSDQKKLSEYVKCINRKRCKILITNADTPDIRNLYRGWNISIIPVIRWVSANGKRYKVNELAITNF
jgi:DNA adenine methylase